MNSIYLVLSIYMFSLFTQVQAQAQAVLVEERGQKIQSKLEHQSRKSSRYLNSFEFKNKNRVGVGLGFAGTHGLVGTQLELNFTPEIAVTTSFGVSDAFQNFGFQIKRSFTGKYFSPYVAGGLTRWYSHSDNGPIASTNPGFLSNKFLTNQEIASGQFTETLIYPSLGMQYIQLDGEWTGSSIYAEVLLLLDTDNLRSAPTGSIGYLYYF